MGNSRSLGRTQTAAVDPSSTSLTRSGADLSTQPTALPDVHQGPLAGVRVLDLSGYIAAPYGCTLLADQGAEVIKIEPPQGDNLRKYPSTLAAEGRAFLGVNRGKQGLVLDLKQPEGRSVLLRLACEADVLVHNFRPSVPARLGLDYHTLHDRR